MDQNTNAPMIKNLIDELGLGNLPQDKQEEIVIKMTELVLKRMFMETMDKLNPADQEKFGEMMEQKADPKEIEGFLTEKIADYDQMLGKIVENLKEEMKKA